MKDVLSPDLQFFIRDILPEKDPLLVSMEEDAEQNHVSIVDYEVASFLKMMVSIVKPMSVLEIGTGLGFSTIHLAKSLPENGKIITIEKSEERFKKASEYINKSGLGHKIEIINGDAREIICEIDGSFDFIFLDAAKGQYGKFLDVFDTILSPGGLIIADNVLVNGWVIDLTIPERRKRTMVVNMRKFLEGFKNNTSYDMSLIPLGDGLALIRKR